MALRDSSPGQPNLRVAVFNFEAGGLRDGRYNFSDLVRARGPVRADLVLLCEAKGWAGDGRRGLQSALAALDAETGLPYVGELAQCDRGPFGPAVLYNPVVVRLRCWHDATPATTPDDKRGLGEFELRGSGAPFSAVVQHWDPRSLVRRRQEAETVDRWGSIRCR
ncbi:hypothetical protein [Dactylosporangium darangshiense]|uniref:hypothetical protein n=1 Tax=Dactylosporangium darangshiense TaxID=579108 RepID=UPI00362EDE49